MRHGFDGLKEIARFNTITKSKVS